jgi:hypothetical protein
MKAKSSVNEYDTFSRALKKVLQVSHSELKSRLDAEKKRKRRKPIRASAVRDSGA